MNCEGLRRTVLLEDDELRPDTAGLRAHYARCPRCRTEFPELALVLPTERRNRERRQYTRVAAAAVLLLGAVLALHRAGNGLPIVPSRVAEPDRSRPLAYTLVVETSVAERDRVTTSIFTHQTHPTPPRTP